MPSNRLIYQSPETSQPTGYDPFEIQTHNATIELLAMVLWGRPANKWCDATHETRERYRAIALGKAELP